jgi:hypothetical protein
MRPEASVPHGTSPESVLDAALARVVRRAWIADTARAIAIAAAIGALATAVLLPQGRGLALLGAGAVALATGAVLVWRGSARRTTRAAAARIERIHPEFRNVIVTAEELRAHPDRASAWMRDRVIRDASSRAGSIRTASVVPVARPLTLLAAAVGIWVAVAAGIPGGAAVTIENAASRVGMAIGQPARDLRIVAELQPPEYTGIPAQQLVNPDRIDAIAGTLLRLRLASAGEPLGLRFGTAAVPIRREGPEFVANVTLTASGYFAIERPGEAPEQGSRTLLPVSVRADLAPAVRIERPGRDLLLPPSTTRIPIAASAADDFAMQSLELRYTKVSGSGEQFEFEEGTVPLRLTRETDRSWKGQVDLALEPLKLGPGDALVYRAVARDRRPGEDGVSSSDTFYVEMQGPGQVVLEGVEMPPDGERYALSQQMVVLKIQRLREREARMARGAIAEETAAIAAEQRSVRANFIFLMGGHVEDEFEEAEHSNEIQEGRLENSARREISAAIHQMTLAEQGLTAVSTARALPPAKAAVEALQRAFGRNRYLLRTLASSSRVDPSRRLTGELKAASDWQRERRPAALDPATRDARALLAGVLEVAATLQSGREVPPAAIAALAEQALAIEPGSPDWQAVASKLTRIREAAEGKRGSEEVLALLNDAVAPIMEDVRKTARQPRGAGSTRAGALLGAWAEEVRK